MDSGKHFSYLKIKLNSSVYRTLRLLSVFVSVFVGVELFVHKNEVE